jgi:hypothetical protein
MRTLVERNLTAAARWPRGDEVTIWTSSIADGRLHRVPDPTCTHQPSSPAFDHVAASTSIGVHFAAIRFGPLGDLYRMSTRSHRWVLLKLAGVNRSKTSQP